MGATWYRGFPSASKNANPLAFAVAPGGARRASCGGSSASSFTARNRNSRGSVADVDAACAAVARASRSPSFVVFVASASGMAADEFARAARALDGVSDDDDAPKTTDALRACAARSRARCAHARDARRILKFTVWPFSTICMGYYVCGGVICVGSLRGVDVDGAH